MANTTWPISTTPGVNAVYYHTLSSTQDYMREYWRVLSNYAVCISDHQYCGRGRLGRTWLEPEGTSLLMSVFLEDLSRTNYGWITIAAALSVREALENIDHNASFTPIGGRNQPVHPMGMQQTHKHRAPYRYALKWPNDVMAVVNNERFKIAGVLGEVLGEKDGSLCAAVGIGVNLMQTTHQLLPGSTSFSALSAPIEESSLPAGSAHTQTSYATYAQLRDTLANRILTHLRSYVTCTPAQLLDLLSVHSCDIGRHVQIQHHGKRVHARITGFTGDGDLKLLAPAYGCNGQKQTITITSNDIALAAASESSAYKGGNYETVCC